MQRYWFATVSNLWRSSMLLACASVLGCVTPPDASRDSLSTHVEDWRDEVIYQIVTDRFANGDYSNDYNVNVSDPTAYHGGDWLGIKDKLDYLQDLGVTALWISPAVKNVESDAGFSSYHGYWTQDFTRPNPHFGDVTALREMVDAAHDRGIKVILDIVTNHVGQAFYYDVNKNGQPDDVLIGQGGPIGYPADQENSTSDLVRITEWDPDFNIAGIQSWTSLGPSGEAPIIFSYDPIINRLPPQPHLFSQPHAYNRKGRVTVWSNRDSCDCSTPGRCEWRGPEHCDLARASLGSGVCTCDPDTYVCRWADDAACTRAQEVLGDFPGGLKDLATTRQDVRDALFDAFAWWIDIGDFDGFRIDTLKHVEQGFWEDFCPRIRQYASSRGKEQFFMFGEAFDGSDDLLGAYTQGQGVDSVFYFSAYYWLFRDRFLGDGSSTCQIERLHCFRHGCDVDPCGGDEAIDARYNGVGKTDGPTDTNGTPLNARQLVVNFAENHDVGRFLYFMPEAWSWEEKRQVLHLGLAYLMTVDGIPSLYYGVEQEFSGGNDPANRETFWESDSYRSSVWADDRWQMAPRHYDSTGDGVEDTAWRPFDRGNPTFQWIKRLAALRKEHVALRRGGFETRWSTQGTGGEDHGIYAFERTHADQSVLVVINLSENRASTTIREDSVMTVGFSSGTTLVDALDGSASYTVEAGVEVGKGTLRVTVPPRGVRILIPSP